MAVPRYLAGVPYHDRPLCKHHPHCENRVDLPFEHCDTCHIEFQMALKEWRSAACLTQCDGCMRDDPPAAAAPASDGAPDNTSDAGHSDSEVQDEDWVEVPAV